MLNYYPMWKYLMLIIVICIGLIYALPNLYGEDPALQITGAHGIDASEATLGQVQDILKKKYIPIKSIALAGGAILVRFNSPDFQLHAREELSVELGDKFVVALHFIPDTPNWLRMLGAKPMKLGLDLRGGVYFLMEVDINTALSNLLEQSIATMRSKLHERGISYILIRKVSKNSIEVRFRDSVHRNRAIHDMEPQQLGLLFCSNGGNSLTASLSDSRLIEVNEYAVQQNITILRNRISQLGITEPLVRRQGTNKIIVELPGIQDIARAKEILGATATLEFRLVNSAAVVSGRVPRDSEVKYTRDGHPIILYKRVILTGNHIIDSSASTDEYNQAQTNVSLDSTGGTLMSNFTKNNIGKLMSTLFVEYKDSGKKDSKGHAVLVKQEEVINIANIQSRLGSSFRITGIGNIHEARQLALLLRAGALIAPIQIVEERIIGPMLGQENITQGLEACLWGLASSIVFMVTWYRKFGVIATIGLILNLILIVSVMSLLPGATLTMPGIAGIVLTLAVAIDANVLINERIKEELNNGNSIQRAIYKGYKGSFSSIIDANVTTLITAVILYFFGTGSLKGFAITTIIGVATSMFTAIIGTRAIVNLLYGGKRINRLSI